MVNKVNLELFNNNWYKRQIGASWLKQICWYFINVCFFCNRLNPSSSLKVWLLKIFGAQVGKNVVIKPAVNIKYPWKLTIGDNSWIGEKVWIDNLAVVRIGRNVCISQGAMLLTGNHDYKKITFDLVIGEIELADGVWIGSRATVCPGIKCGTHSVLSALSVATTNLGSYKIYQGNPAQEIRERKISDHIE